MSPALLLGISAVVLLGCQRDIVEPRVVSGPVLAPGGGTTEPVLYNVTMSNVGTMGILTDCNPPGTGSVVATLTGEGPGGLSVKVGGGGSNDTFLLNAVNTAVQWTRQYDAGRGLSGVFDGCYGSTAYHPGTLFLGFGTKKGRSYVNLTWHFDYYIAPDVREHFSLLSEDIPFPPWDGAGVSGRVAGSFDLTYFNSAERIRYEPFPGGAGLDFEFDLSVTRIP